MKYNYSLVGITMTTYRPGHVFTEKQWEVLAHDSQILWDETKTKLYDCVRLVEGEVVNIEVTAPIDKFEFVVVGSGFEGSNSAMAFEVDTWGEDMVFEDFLPRIRKIMSATALSHEMNYPAMYDLLAVNVEKRFATTLWAAQYKEDNEFEWEIEDYVFLGLVDVDKLGRAVAGDLTLLEGQLDIFRPVEYP